MVTLPKQNGVGWFKKGNYWARYYLATCFKRPIKRGQGVAGKRQTLQTDNLRAANNAASGYQGSVDI